MKIHVLSAVALLLCLPAQAQTVVQAASAQLQPQVRRDAEGFAECGLRATVIDLLPDGADAYDFTLSLRLGLKVGMFKAGKANTSMAMLKKHQHNINGILPGPVNFWMAKEEEGKPMLPLKIIPADTPGFILGGVDFGQAWANILGMADGERMQFAVRYKNQPVDTVISFATTLKDEERKSLMACFDGLVKRMAVEIDADKKTKK
jgi:hypothetical protein